MPERPRTKTINGKLLYWCSAFDTYLMAKRCDDEKAFATRDIDRGRILMGFGKRMRVDQITNEEYSDLKGCAQQRKERCLGCPGVTVRSYQEKRKGELV